MFVNGETLSDGSWGVMVLVLEQERNLHILERKKLLVEDSIFNKEPTPVNDPSSQSLEVPGYKNKLLVLKQLWESLIEWLKKRTRTNSRRKGKF